MYTLYLDDSKSDSTAAASLPLWLPYLKTEETFRQYCAAIQIENLNKLVYVSANISVLKFC